MKTLRNTLLGLLVTLALIVLPPVVLAQASGNYSGDDDYDPAAGGLFYEPTLSYVANFSGDDAYDLAVDGHSAEVPTPFSEPTMARWIQKAFMPTARWGLSTCAVNGKIYAIGGIGGLAKMEEYDPTTDTWASKAEMPTGRSHPACGAVNGKIYVIGGNAGHDGWGTSLATVEEYDPATDTWTKKIDMPTARDALGVAVVNGKIYAIGGDVVRGRYKWDTLRTVEEYDPATNTWNSKSDMNRGRETFSAVAIDDKIYTVGAFTPYGEMYDPVTDTWTKTTAMPSTRIFAAASPINGKIYVFGGDDSGGGPPTSALFEYNPVADKWKSGADMPFKVLGASASVVNGKVYIVGGSAKEMAPPPHLTTVWEYVPTS